MFKKKEMFMYFFPFCNFTVVGVHCISKKYTISMVESLPDLNDIFCYINLYTYSESPNFSPSNDGNNAKTNISDQSIRLPTIDILYRYIISIKINIFHYTLKTFNY